jgi:hypothetical protein
LITFGWLVVFWAVVLLGATFFVITLMKRERLVVLSPLLVRLLPITYGGNHVHNQPSFRTAETAF